MMDSSEGENLMISHKIIDSRDGVHLHVYQYTFAPRRVLEYNNFVDHCPTAWQLVGMSHVQ